MSDFEPAVPVLLPDVRTDTHVDCRVCGKTVTFRQSRLFFIGDGTVRTCKKGLAPHTEKGKP